MKINVICFLLLFANTTLFAQVAAFSGKDTDVVVDSVKLAKDTKTVTVSVDISVVLPSDPTIAQKYTVEDANGGTLISNKDYVPFPKNNLVFSPGAVLRQVVTLKIKKETNVGTIVLCLKDSSGGLVSIYTINIKKPADKFFKSLSVSIGGGLNFSGSNPKINGFAFDMRLFSPEITDKNINIWPFITFSGFGFEAGIFSNNNIAPPDSANIPYTQVYALGGIVPNNIDAHQIVTENGVYKKATSLTVTGLYFMPYFRIWNLEQSNDLVTKASLYFTPRFEFDSRIYDYSFTLTPQTRDTISMLGSSTKFIYPPTDSFVHVSEGYVGYLGFTLHVVLEKSLDFRISYIKGIVVSDKPNEATGWYTAIPVFFEERNSGLSISAEIRFKHVYTGVGPGWWEIIFPSKSYETYYTLNVSKRFSLQKFADIIFGSGS
jgi:hypothetical protein